MDWARILAYVTGTVDQELLGRNEYLAAENRILKAQLKGRPECSVSEAPIAPAQGPAASRAATQREFEASAFPSAITARRTKTMAARAAIFLVVSKGFAAGMLTGETPLGASAGHFRVSVSLRVNRRDFS